MEDQELLIQGAQPDPSGDEPWQPLEFSRVFRVPNTVDPAGISAELKQGVLRLTLKKREEAKPRRIEVQIA
jgi:HSP20 family protein